MIDKRILVVIMKDDYGDPARGTSYEHEYFYRTLESMFVECRLFDFGSYLSRVEALQADLLQAAEEFRPDVIFFTMYENQFRPETLDALRRHALTVNWFCDDQWRFDGFSSRYCRHFSHVITTDPLAVGKYRAHGYENAILSQWAAADTLPAYSHPDAYLHDVSFVGQHNPFRAWLVRRLEARGIQVACYGAGWRSGRVAYERMKEIFHGSRINLNLSNSKNHDVRFVFSSLGNYRSYRSTRKVREQIKGRHFEIAGFGGFQLTNYVEFLENYFSIGREIALFNTIDDLADKIRYYLDESDLRRGTAAAGFERVLREHTYRKRFGEVFRRMGLAQDRSGAGVTRGGLA
jgi:spore maturation protein CgeB